jgi:hypothetical protein
LQVFPRTGCRFMVPISFSHRAGVLGRRMVLAWRRWISCQDGQRPAGHIQEHEASEVSGPDTAHETHLLRTMPAVSLSTTRVSHDEPSGARRR